MEDAAKALIIAAGIMMGIMIMVIGVTLYSRYRKVAEGYDKLMSTQEISKINKEFEKYEGIEVTPEEVIGVVTYANSFNERYFDGGFYYDQVKTGGFTDSQKAPIIVYVQGSIYTKCNVTSSGISKVEDNKKVYIKFIKDNINNKYNLKVESKYGSTSNLEGLVYIVKITKK